MKSDKKTTILTEVSTLFLGFHCEIQDASQNNSCIHICAKTLCAKSWIRRIGFAFLPYE